MNWTYTRRTTGSAETLIDITVTRDHHVEDKIYFKDAEGDPRIWLKSRGKLER
jgi:hypothetical protein